MNRRRVKKNWVTSLAGLTICAFIVCSTLQRTAARPRPATAAAQSSGSGLQIGSKEIRGVVTSSKGPEAGVWVIAETDDLPTKFRKIVVTDDLGRYLLPDLPKAIYKVWVRGYGLADSQPVQASPGTTLALTAVVAADAQAAAQYYPANYWYALMQLPPKNAFPLTMMAPAERDAPSASTGGDRPAAQVAQRVSQADWIYSLKRGCGACHQMGNKFTREVPSELGRFDTGAQAWQRRIQSGQEGGTMVRGVSLLGYDLGIGMFSDWTNRVAEGDLPPAPKRPEGLERNVVLTLWDVGTPKSFVHDAISTDKHNPVANANGPVYATEWSSGMFEGIDPVENTKFEMKIPVPGVAAEFRRTHPQKMLKPSPYWGDEIVFDDTLNQEGAQRDSKGRVWFTMANHKVNPAYCKPGSNNPFAKNYPIVNNGRDIEYFDPKSNKFTTIETCFGGSHMMFDTDKDETLYMSAGDDGGPSTRFGIGWIDTRIWDETHDAEKSQGWCPAVVDTNGDGKAGAFTKQDEPFDPKLDRMFPGHGYGAAVNPVDHSVWYASLAPSPGRIVRIVPGANPPATCMTEVYEPPYDNPKLPGVESYFPEGIDVDTNGVVWAALTGTNDLAAFDRRKCKVFNGPAATGQQCPEGWTLYPVPGPKFKGSTIPSDFFYMNWVDQFNTLGLGNNVSVVTGTNSDSLIAFEPGAKKFVTLRVPYPLGFYTRYVDGRIDDPKAGWKGRGLWSSNDTRMSWHNEGGKGTTSYIVHFQLRPDPLAK
ncbi:MAG: carboxypeptidase regulatory-like domain-containing protein [Candidatus Acidiferrales bacterium]